LDTRNSYPDHIGLETIDRNVDHTRWPCCSHPPELSCEDAVAALGQRGIRSLLAQRQLPVREWSQPR
jgi:hypothetical protein